MIVDKTGNFVRPADLRDGDAIEIISEGSLVHSSLSDKDQLVLDVRLPNGEVRRWAPNGTTRNGFIDSWGNNTAAWIGHRARVRKQRMSVRGIEREVVFATALDGARA